MKIFLIISIIIISIVVLLFLTLIIGDIIAFKPPKPKKKFNWDFHENYSSINKEVFFKSGGTKLRGFLYDCDNPKGLVIFCHGIGTSSDYYTHEIRYLQSQKYRVFTFDYKGYWKNKGVFAGIYQVVKDLNSAINFIDDGSLPLTLIGHSLGGHAVSCVSKINTHKIDNVIAISGFSNSVEILDELLNKLHITKCHKLIGFFVKIAQSIFFGGNWKTTAHEEINKNKSETKYLIVHSKDDEEVNVNHAAIYAHKKDITNPNVKYKLFEEKPFNTHMGIIRGNKSINPELMETIIKRIEE